MSDPSFHTPSPLEAAQAAQASAESIADALKVSERQYRRLFEASRDGILLLDSDVGRITDSNPYMTELLGYSHDEFLGRELWEIGLHQDRESGQAAFRQLKRDGYIRYEDLPLENRKGERREVEFVSNLYRENGHTVIQCNIRDITERKRLAAELAAAASELMASAAIHGRQAAVLEERARLAREIHDTLAQGFAGIITQLEAAEASLAKAHGPVSPDALLAYEIQLGKVKSRIEKARDLARDSLSDARRSVAALRSPPLEAASLSESLSHFLTQRVLGTGAKSNYVLEGVPRDLPVVIEHCVLRVGQAAIANAVEHAEAQSIDVRLSFEPGTMRLSVRDDGRGFDVELLGQGRFGIIGMRERAEKDHGKLIIVSRPGEGTNVELIVPVSGQDALH